MTFWVDFWPNFVATFLGLILGMPCAWLVERALEARRDRLTADAQRERRIVLAGMIRDSLASIEGSVFGLARAVISDKSIEVLDAARTPLDTFTWNAVRGEFRHLSVDVKLLQISRRSLPGLASLIS